MTESGRWVDVAGADIRVGDRVRQEYTDITVREVDRDTRCFRDTYGRWHDDYGWQRLEPVPAAPDCRGSSLPDGHLYPGETVERYDRHPGWRTRRADGTGILWTADRERANPTRAVCPTCARKAAQRVNTTTSLPPDVLTVQYVDLTPPPPPDPLAAVRAEAKRLLAEGVDPRAVLGAWDSKPSGSVDEFVERVDDLLQQYGKRGQAENTERARTARCYHGRIGATCGYCIEMAKRSDARE